MPKITIMSLTAYEDLQLKDSLNLKQNSIIMPKVLSDVKMDGFIDWKGVA